MPKRRSWLRTVLGLIVPGLGLCVAGDWVVGCCCLLGVAQLLALGWADIAANTVTFDEGTTFVRTHFVQSGGRVGAQAIWSFMVAAAVHGLGAWAGGTARPPRASA